MTCHFSNQGPIVKLTIHNQNKKNNQIKHFEKS
jgi:hypothetical protein